MEIIIFSRAEIPKVVNNRFGKSRTEKKAASILNFHWLKKDSLEKRLAIFSKTFLLSILKFSLLICKIYSHVDGVGSMVRKALTLKRDKNITNDVKRMASCNYVKFSNNLVYLTMKWGSGIKSRMISYSSQVVRKGSIQTKRRLVPLLPRLMSF